MVDFQSSSRSRHACLIATALSELRGNPGARVIGVGLPAKTLLWWEEVAPDVRVGMLRSSTGLYTVEELCAGATEDGGPGFRVNSDFVILALKKAYAGGGPVDVTLVSEAETRTVVIQPETGSPDMSDLRKKTIALLKPADAPLRNGCLDRTGPAYALMESAGARTLKQRLVFQAGERICVSGTTGRVIIYDEQANWLGIATAR